MSEYRRPPDPLALRSDFRERTIQRQAILSFAEARPRLPEPILPGYPDWIELYWRAWEMVAAQMTRPSPGSGLPAPYFASGSDASLVVTDAAFATQFLAYGRRAFPGITLLDNFYARQQDDGFICRAISATDGSDLYPAFDPDGSGPDLLPWAEWRYYRQTGDGERLHQVVWALLAAHRWRRANRSWPGGLYWTTGVSGGTGNQPRVPGGERHHQHWSWVDASMQAALSTGLLEKIAAQTGVMDVIDELAAERLALHDQINRRLWHDTASFYQDIDQQGRFSQVKSIVAYWALLDPGLVPAAWLDSFVQHLREVEAFKTVGRVPSMSADSPGFEPQTGDGWRGAVWPSATYVVIKGLQHAGQARLAHEIALAHLAHIAGVFRRTDTFWENYAPASLAAGSPSRPAAIAQTGLAPIAMLLEEIIGVVVDWPAKRVTWQRMLEPDQVYGVRNFPLGSNGTLNLLSEADQVIVETTEPFTLHIRDRNLDLKIPVPAGSTTVALE